MLKVLVDEIPIPGIFDMCNTGFFLFDPLFSELTLIWCQLDLNGKFEKFSIRTEMKIIFIQMLIGISGFTVGYMW